jgi:protein required for attachment to host cells
MNTYLVAVVDGTKARFLTLKPLDMPEYESGPTLVEQAGLSGSEKEHSGEELWTTTKPGRNRGAAGQAHGYDDHREQHMAEFSRRFAQAIAQQLQSLMSNHQANTLILVAEPQTLGILREVLDPKLPHQVTVHELAKDLCALKPHEIQDYLAKRDLLPAYRYVATSR